MIAETDNNFGDISLDEVAESGVEIDDAVPKQDIILPTPARRGRHIGARTDPLQAIDGYENSRTKRYSSNYAVPVEEVSDNSYCLFRYVWQGKRNGNR